MVVFVSLDRVRTPGLDAHVPGNVKTAHGFGLDWDDVIDHIITTSVVAAFHFVVYVIDAVLNFGVVSVDVSLAFGFSVLLICGADFSFVIWMRSALCFQSLFVLSVPGACVLSFVVFPGVVVSFSSLSECVPGFGSENCSTYRLTRDARVVRHETRR